MMKNTYLSKRNPLSWMARIPTVTAVLLAALMAAFFIIPLFALIWRAATLEGDTTTTNLSISTAVLLSLGTTAVTVLLIILLGTPLAYIMARHKFPAKRLLSIFIEMPVVMPPIVAGLALLSTFGRRGFIGQMLAKANVTIPFTVTAVILSQLFVSAPFYIRAAQSRFATLPKAYEEAAAVDGASQWRIFWQVILPQSSRALLNGLILSWARALGEFGATILFAGNLQGRTQTMPLLVYGALEQNLRATFTTALILLGLAAAAFALTRRLADTP